MRKGVKHKKRNKTGIKGRLWLVTRPMSHLRRRGKMSAYQGPFAAFALSQLRSNIGWRKETHTIEMEPILVYITAPARRSSRGRWPQTCGGETVNFLVHLSVRSKAIESGTSRLWPIVPAYDGQRPRTWYPVSAVRPDYVVLGTECWACSVS
jgi:hypothetical protein